MIALCEYAFIKNAEAMNIDLKNLDKIIISHGHDDHTRGLKYYFKYNNKKEPTVLVLFY